MLIPTSGEALLFDQNVIKHGAELRNKIGYIPSEVNYYDTMTSKELLLYSAGFYEDVNKQIIYELAEYFELNLEKRISELSTGNKKKTAIVQSFLHEPELLIMDEPTSGLDPLIKNKFFDLLEEKNEKGMTVFFSSHILSEVQRFCNKAAVIREGEIIAIENVKDLLKSQVKRCRMTFKQPVKDMEFPDNFKNITKKSNRLTFDFHGEVNDLVKWTSSYELIDISIEEPDLETIFMNYYRR